MKLVFNQIINFRKITNKEIKQCLVSRLQNTI